MAKHADIRMFALEKGSSILRVLPAFIQNMEDGDAAACQFDYGLGRKYALSIIVDVAGIQDDKGWALSLIFGVPNLLEQIESQAILQVKDFLHPHNPIRSASE
jgi:hypothetical protein